MFNSNERTELKARITELEKTLELKNNELRLARKSIYDWKTTALKMRGRVFSHGATPDEKMLLEFIYDQLEQHGVLDVGNELAQLAVIAKAQRDRACINRSWDNPESVQGDAVQEPTPQAKIFWIDEAEQQKPD